MPAEDIDKESAYWEALSVALTSSLTLSLTFQNFLRALGDGFPAEGVFSNFYDRAKRSLIFLAHATRSSAEEPTLTVEIPQRIVARVRPRSESVYRVDDVERDGFTAYVAPRLVPGIRSYVMLRLQIEGRHLGIVCFYSRKPRAFRTEHEELLARFSTLIALNVGFALAGRLQCRNEALESENLELQRTLVRKDEAPLLELLANTPSFKSFAPTLRQAALYNVPVLITGESGTGKDVVAQTIHQMSARRSRPFVRVNCSAIPEHLFESAFFGHEAGAFTDAKRMHAGFFEEADGGTLFLDEIGEMPQAMQAKLLTVLQSGIIRRVGARVDIRTDVRIIAATNQPLQRLVELKRFRLDLLYRLNVLALHLKPLRERCEDLRPLAKLFLKQCLRRYGVDRDAEILPEAFAEAENCRWPGNVRELRNVVARSLLEALQSGKGDESAALFIRRFVLDSGQGLSSLVVKSVANSQSSRESTVTSNPSGRTINADGMLCLSAHTSFESLQRAYFTMLLRETKGKISGPNGAAEIAGIHPNTLRSRLQKLGVTC